MLQLKQMLDGKKTYLISGLSILIGLLQLVLGMLNGTVPVNDWRQVVPYLLVGSLGMAVRAAIAKIEAKLPAGAQPLVNAEVEALEGQVKTPQQ